MKVLAGAFGIRPGGSKAGVVTFSYNAEHSIRLKDHDQMSSFMQAVDSIPLMGSTTRIDKALRLSQSELFSLSNGARPGIPKLLILLTDGSQTQDVDAEDPSAIANELRKKGIKVIVIGIGSGVDQAELIQLGGGDDNVFSANTFEELIGGEFITKVTTSSCDTGMLQFQFCGGTETFYKF